MFFSVNVIFALTLFNMPPIQGNFEEIFNKYQSYKRILAILNLENSTILFNLTAW